MAGVFVELLDQLNGLRCEARVAAMTFRQRGRPGVLEGIRPMGLRTDPPGEAVGTEPVGRYVEGFLVEIALAGLRIVAQQRVVRAGDEHLRVGDVPLAFPERAVARRTEVVAERR